MSDTSFMKGIFAMDIETAGDPDRVQFVPAPAIPVAADAPKSMKKPDTRQKWAATKYVENLVKYDAALSKMALDVDLCRIVAIGWQVVITQDGALSTVAVGADNVDEEADALCAFWRAWDQFGSRMCGFNILGFDLPVIMRRSWVLGVPFAPINLRRYSTEYVIDLMQLFYGWGQYPGPKYRGLKTLAKMYGIPIPQEGVDGSQVAEMTKAEREDYCLSDVDVTWELANRMHGPYWT